MRPDRTGRPAREPSPDRADSRGADLSPLPEGEFDDYLDRVRQLVLAEIDEIIPRSGTLSEILYARMRDYPLRPAKGLRPALCYALCRAAGGRADEVMRTAAVLELYHNAFLIHDDVEDGSFNRRNEPTLHSRYGRAIAVNVGDGMLLLCQEALDENLRLLGLGTALRIRRVVYRMSREAVEGQAMELEWIRTNRWDIADADYLRMVHKKTTWYSFTAPLLLGAVIGGVPEERHFALRCLATLLGAAFQIQDDILNLIGDPGKTGKESRGDLWEGKHTLVIAHMMRTVGPARRKRLSAILAKARPGPSGNADSSDLRHSGRSGSEVETRTAEDVEELMLAIRASESIEYARDVAARRVRRAAGSMSTLHAALPSSVHRDFLDAVVDFVLRRTI